MENKTLHIVSLDVPFPPDYGGMIDVFYRIKTLKKLGYAVILHCFTYGRGKPKELLEHCQEVYFYERKKSFFQALKRRPFIVETRKSEELLNRLLKDEYPILMEGIHCCWLLENEEIQRRKTMVRVHNVEHDYYQALKENANGLKRIFFDRERKKLKRYEPILAKASYLLAIKKGEQNHFKKINSNTHLLPASLPDFKTIDGITIKEYCLFHGNLSVAENDLSAKWLLKEVVPHLGKIEMKIAGKNPSEVLIALAKAKNVQLIANPSQKEMQQLIQEARIHTLPTTQSTGLKLKLFAALQTIGVTLVNSKMVDGNDLSKYCIVADSAKDFTTAIKDNFYKPFNLEERKQAINRFLQEMDTLKNVEDVFKTINKG